MHTMRTFFVFISAMCYALVSCDHLNIIQKMQDHCDTKANPLRCYKIKALRYIERVGKSRRLQLFEGLELTQEANRTARLAKKISLKDKELEDMDDDKFDDMMYRIAYDFLESHSITMNIPKIVEEARRKKKNRFTGPFLAALAIKGLIMSMAYKSIAVMSGTALIIGKMALILAAILGLKKLVSSDKEKTTVEIVKHPTHSTSHTYSSSIEEGEGHYHRSMTVAEDMVFLEKLLTNIY